VLSLEAVACKDWLTNKVDRCVGGHVAKQQCAGALQLPLNNVGVMALDYESNHGTATSIGHSPISGLIDAKAGAVNSVAEALTNIIWAPLEKGLESVSLSANWMWPCKTPGEDARLYQAVEAIADFAIALGINIPTGKDSLSMKQKYKQEEVIAPGTVVISSVAHCNNIQNIVEPVLQKNNGPIYYLNLSQDDCKLGGSSFAQTRNAIGRQAPCVQSAAYFKNAFNTIQDLIKAGKVQAGHDVSSGGLITTLLEMCFADNDLGASIDLTAIDHDLIKVLFNENAAIVLQATEELADTFHAQNIDFIELGHATTDGILKLTHPQKSLSLDINSMRDIWYETSHLLDLQQTREHAAQKRKQNFKQQPLRFTFPENFSGKRPIKPNTTTPIKAAIIREKGSNSEREMANAMYMAGFEVRDVHMTDLIAGREDLKDIQFIGAVGGFSNSDVLGSAKGWAGS
ncbi:MAG: phosphoribosylformylglycinamidine synthase subunit PurQ, partial [Deltaproteobacteria bacterium]|nr:phosphoribosylformylglycinamidine synthase subunit PurQ [Deltaproteobacteria bacterium]